LFAPAEISCSLRLTVIDGIDAIGRVTEAALPWNLSLSLPLV
jgi:hypothetical protein